MTDQTQMLRDFEAEYRNVTGSIRTVRRSDRLTDGLGIDSLTATELLVWLEDQYEIDLLGDSRLKDAVTVGELLDLIVAVQGSNVRDERVRA